MKKRRFTLNSLSLSITALFFILMGFKNPKPLHLQEMKSIETSQRPIIFGKSIISTEDDEFGTTFTPDGKTCFFCIKSPSTISKNVILICFSHFENGKWSEPEIAPFSGKYKDFNPAISPDGQKLFFISNRPIDEKKKSDTDIWMVEKMGENWSAPKNIGSPVNTSAWELGCSVANDGTLYFSSTGTTGNTDIYFAKLVDGKYQTPENIGDAVNSEASETDPFIAPDQSYLLFASQGRADALSEAGASISYPRGDLYISFKKDGKWQTAQNLGANINSSAEESNPWVSQDGKTLYFTSERNFVTIPMQKKLKYSILEENLHSNANGLGDIYQISFSKFINKNQ